MNAAQHRENRALLAKLIVIVIGMFGFGYALVPFYEKICEVTGLRNLAYSRGLTMPKLAIIESEALNAFASGVNDRQYTVSVTTGLIATLDEKPVAARFG